MEEVPVLIVGAGVVGLSSSLFLSQHGVKSLLVERHTGTSIHPRARGVTARTMELYRGFGIDAAIRKAGEANADSFGIYSGRTLVEVMNSHSFRNKMILFLIIASLGFWYLSQKFSFFSALAGLFGVLAIAICSLLFFFRHLIPNSPTTFCRCTQDLLEPVLLEAARSRGVEALFSTELTSISQDSKGVTATLLDRTTNRSRSVRCSYVIAADGARSPVRGMLGVAWDGPGKLSSQLNLLVKCDLTRVVKGKFSLCMVENSSLRGLFASINNKDIWVLHIALGPNETAEDYPPDRCVDMIKAAVGVTDLEVELKGCLPWDSVVRHAGTFQINRVFLAGDSAHVMPPWGGFGANTGIQDAHNLAWKIAAVMRGDASSKLLATYEEERKPVALHVASIAQSMNDERGLMIGGGFLNMTFAIFRRLTGYLVVGYGYTSKAVILEPGNKLPGPGTTDLKGRPGTRSPHVWLERSDDGSKVSSLDLCDHEMTLLTGVKADGWRVAATEAAKELGIKLQVLQEGKEFRGKWSSSFGVKSDGVVLVRPDGFVAWRAKNGSNCTTEAFSAVIKKILARD